jgi:hypothetical protein
MIILKPIERSSNWVDPYTYQEIARLQVLEKEIGLIKEKEKEENQGGYY